ncbi:MAG: DUF305 domain-containing protein [Elusimicrobiota bacterium]|nr:MAG: DUF305 domain-containing protein [Elusimicrobiota bacterium]
MKTALILALASAVTGGVVFVAYTGDEAKGADPDRQFVEQTLVHHRRAITLAQDEQVKGKDPRAKALAGEVLEVQTKQAKQLETWLARRASQLR